MQRRVLLILAVLACVPAVAQAAIVISVGNHALLPNTAGQDIDILLSGAGEYSASDWVTAIDAGGPQVTAVFAAPGPGGAIPGGNLAGSIWAGGSAGMVNDVGNLTYPTDDGRAVAGSSIATGGGVVNQTTNGIFLTLTLTTENSGAGPFTLSLAGSNLLFWDAGEFDLFDVPGVTFEPGTLTVPEPGAMVLGLFAVAGLAVVAVRRHRGRRAG
jgi:PEP-CTERM motif